jgi:thiol-disulfide isomerase/thioredoxin
MATMMRRTQSWTPTANAPPAGHKLRRSSQSLPADLALRRSVISFSTDFTVHQPDAPALQRVMPTIRVGMAPRIDPAERRGVSLIVERANRRQARVITHTLTVDAWLLTLLLLFTFVGSSSGLMLPAIPVGAQRFTPYANVAPYVAGTPGSGVSQLQPSRSTDLKGFISDADSTFTREAERTAAVDPSLAAVMQFLNWNEKFEEDNPEAHFAAEVKRREAAKTASSKPRKIATGAELRQELSQPTDKPTVVVFGAKSCRMCKMVQPKVERAAAKGGAALLYMHYNTESEDVYREHGISQTPTVHVYDTAGQLVSSAVYKVADVPKLASVLQELSS